MHEEIQKIQSFRIDHDRMEPGIYISRIDGDIITYDLRTRKPNAGEYMDNLTMHSVEHMFATLIRNSRIAEDVVYFGPMGCQTGFYLVVRDRKPVEVYQETLAVIREILAYEGAVFGASRKECGNYRNLSLESAKTELAEYYKKIEHWEDMSFAYRE